MAILLSLLSTYANRLILAINGEITNGEVVSFTVLRGYRTGTNIIPYIAFMNEGEQLFFSGVENMDCDRGDIVPVIFNKKDPEEAFVYTFIGFWFLPLIYALVPIFILVAIPLSFLKYKEGVEITISPFTVNKRKRPPLELQ